MISTRDISSAGDGSARNRGCFLRALSGSDFAPCFLLERGQLPLEREYLGVLLDDVEYIGTVCCLQPMSKESTETCGLPRPMTGPENRRRGSLLRHWRSHDPKPTCTRGPSRNALTVHISSRMQITPLEAATFRRSPQ